MKGKKPQEKENIQTSIPARKQTTAQKKASAESEEQLYAIIEELKADLQFRDQEFEALRKKVDKLNEQNAWLRKERTEERLKSITVLSKLNKISNLKELESNYAVI